LFDDRSHSRPAYSRRASPENPSLYVFVYPHNPMVFFAQTMTGFRVVVKGRWNGIGKQVFSVGPFESIYKGQIVLI
jgi:hypothetical protein